MLLLNSNATLVRLITASATDIEVSSEAMDAPNPITPSSNITPVPDVPANITSAATTTIVAAPAASTTRNVKGLTIANNHATLSNLCTVEKFDGADAVVLWKGTLLAGERVIFDEVGVWTLYGADGIVKQPGLTTYQQLSAVSALPGASDPDTLKVFAQKIAGRMTLRTMGPSGVDQTLQDKISTNKNVIYLPNASTTVGLNLGLAWTSGGTVSHPTPSSTAPAIYNQQKRTRWANVVTTTNQFLGLRTATAEKIFWRGNAAGLGGWNFHARFAIGLWPAATVRLFVGLNDSNAGWVISDTLTGNGCGLWHDTTEAASVLTFVTRDGTTATKSAGIPLAANLAAGQCFDFNMWCAPNGGSIFYRLVEQNTGTTLVDSSTSTTIPLTTAFLGPELAMSNGTANITVTTTAFELSSMSCQSDN